MANLTSLGEGQTSLATPTSLLRSKNFTKRRNLMRDSELRTRAKALGLHILSVCDDVDTRKGRGVLVNQIIRSATSIGANIHEANYASSKADFINKFHVALKECAETEYWVEMLVGCNAITQETAQAILQECGIIRRMLAKSVTTAKRNME
ncbi:MAG: four helix bundle protein [Ruminococcaceae bacterium]|nr:four helix bundle protein [Oscillospiraceae bacterium]